MSTRIISKSTLLPLAVVLGSGLASTAAAQDADERIGGSDQPFYSGTSFISVDPGLDNLDAAYGLAQTVGIRVPGVSWLGFELDLGFTLFGGENSGSTTTVGGGGGGGGLIGGGGGDEQQSTTSSGDDFQAITYGLFSAFRTPGRFFVGTRLGVAGFSTNIEELDEDNTGFAYSLQAGYRWSEASHNLIQFEFLEYDNDVEYMAITAHYAID
ncbi:MAG: hypothetical protein CMH65_15780 [Nevskiales bacterium]|nr:hypothetical protein [Nevskiales bacterium]